MQATKEKRAETKRRWSLAILFVVVLGLVSLLADTANEGSKSITGAYLALLGASAVTIGIVAGLSELIGYSLRVVFGWVTDRTGRYWTLTFIGYGINLVAVPALALAGDWTMAVCLIMIERIGRAVRGPARDAMLSHASVDVGRGWAYGIQEALSSVGGMLGPMVVVMVMFFGGDYRLGFEVLIVPALLAVVLLVYAQHINPRPRDTEGLCAQKDVKKRLPNIFWFFVLAGALMAAGYADFPLISYYICEERLVEDGMIPVLYALAMAADALSALYFGKMYDRHGMGVLIGAAILAPVFMPLTFSGDVNLLLLGMVLYGIGFGAQESIMRAIVADMAPYCRRGSAFGYYNAAFGISWFLGSILIGLLYDVSLALMIWTAAGLQLAAVPVLIYVKRNFKFRRRGEVCLDEE